MKVLDRYIIRQVLITALFAVGVLSVVLVLANIFKRLLELLVTNDAPVELIVSFIAYVLPFSLTFTIPWGFLTAILLVFGKLSAEHELTALRASGISIARVCVPVFLMAFACVGLCFWINVDVAPRALLKMKDAVYTIVTSNPMAMFGSDKVIDSFPGRKIYVERNEGAELFNLLVYELNDSLDPERVIFAKRGLLETNPEKKELLLRIFDARYEQRDKVNPGDLARMNHGITMQESAVPISLAELYEKNKKKRGVTMMTTGELMDRWRDEVPTPAERSATRTEVNKRFSVSLAALAFTLIGVPLAITAQRRENSIGFLLSVVVAFLYYMFLQVADMLKQNAAMHPELLVWLPNVVFLGIGAWMFTRLRRQ